MIEVFVDTGYWLALLLPRDELHHIAIEAIKMLKPERLVTSELVLTEVLNHVSNSTPYTREEASGIWSDAHQNPAVIVVPASESLLRAGHKLYSSRLDKSWSFTDCTSFAIMTRRKIQSALTADHHFEQAGFRALLS